MALAIYCFALSILAAIVSRYDKEEIEKTYPRVKILNLDISSMKILTLGFVLLSAFYLLVKIKFPYNY